jgi:hypothetical protein
MNSTFTQLRRLLSSWLVAILLLVAGVGYLGHPLPAEAASLTPEARSYRVDNSDRISASSQRATEKAQETGEGFVDSLKDAADTVREKLNLDEPIPESTKTSLKQLRGEEVTTQSSDG